MNQVISKDGTAIAFDRSGKGPEVMLVGGAFQYRAIDPRTAQLATLLAQHFTVFHYDRRGRGDSGDTQPYAIEREIEDLEALINEAGGRRSCLGCPRAGSWPFTLRREVLLLKNWRCMSHRSTPVTSMPARRRRTTRDS